MTPESSRNGHIRSALLQMFNGDVGASCNLLRQYVDSAPNDPLGYSMSAAVPFYSFVADRMQTQHGGSIRRIILGHGLAMPSELQHELSAHLQRAQLLALNALAADPRDQNAIFALCVMEGVSRDMMALVFKRWLLSFRHAQAATHQAMQLLSINPQAHDAYFVIGFSEYLVQEIPVFLRPFAKIPGIVGQTSRAIQFLEAASTGGEYFKEFATQMLVTVYEELGRLDDALRTVSKLTAAFPDNRTYQNIFTKLSASNHRR